MLRTSYINHLNYYFSKETVVLNDLVNDFSEDILKPFGGVDEFREFSNEFFPSNLSIEKELTLQGMFFQLLEKSIDEQTIDREKINYIILAIEEKNALQNFGHFLQHKLGFTNANVVHTAGNYCANIDVALGLGSAIVKSDTSSEVLIITGNKISKLNDRIIGTYAVLGDAVGMMTLSDKKNDKGIEIVCQQTITKGELHQIDLQKDNTVLLYESYVDCIEGALSKSQLNTSDIQQVFLHNANTMLIEEALIACDIDTALIYTENKASYGHLDTVDLILNIKNYLEKENDSPQYILSLSSGITGTYCCTIYKI